MSSNVIEHISAPGVCRLMIPASCVVVRFYITVHEKQLTEITPEKDITTTYEHTHRVEYISKMLYDENNMYDIIIQTVSLPLLTPIPCGFLMHVFLAVRLCLGRAHTQND
jgi:hypothetical protein